MDESNLVDVYWRGPYVVTMGIMSIRMLPFTCAVVMTWKAYHSTAAGHATRCSSVSVTYFRVQTHTNIYTCIPTGTEMRVRVCVIWGWHFFLFMMRKACEVKQDKMLTDGSLWDSRLDLDEALQRASPPGCIVNHLLIKNNGFEVHQTNCVIQQ